MYFRDIISHIHDGISSMYYEGGPVNDRRKNKNMSHGRGYRIRRNGKYYDFDDSSNNPTPPMRPTSIGFKTDNSTSSVDWKKKKKLKKLKKKGEKLLKDWEALGKLILKEVNNE